MMRAIAMAGPRASEQQIKSFFDPKIEFTVLSSATPADVLSELGENHFDVAIIFGGDGTVNRHLSQLANTGIPVLVVPCGSGNDLARVAGTDPVDAALNVWKRFIEGDRNARDIDLGRIAASGLAEPRYFSCCANVGLDADAARRTDQMPDWVKSHGGYFLGGLMALARYKPQMMTVRSEQKAHVEPGWFVSVSNTPTFGGGLKIAPQASVSDGQLDVTFVSAELFSRVRLASHFPKILSGQHVNIRELSIFSTDSLSIQTEHPSPVYGDGEYITQTPCTIEVARAALRLVTATVL